MVRTKKTSSKERPLQPIIGVASMCAIALMIAAVLWVERTVPAFVFSADRAYEEGNRRFDAIHPRSYDIQTAEVFLYRAIALDSHHAGAYHQLARIAFLRGDFPRALALINSAIVLAGEKPIASSYYVRGLIKGYMDDFEGAAEDYRVYLETDPTNWAAANDLAWVLLKSEKYEEALRAVDLVLPQHTDNAWLLNSKATALFELGRYEEAHRAAEAASRAVANVKDSDWSLAYPGNDPLIAKEGVVAFHKAVLDNLERCTEALSSMHSE